MINWDAIAAIGELVAALAVIFSLIYVGKELAQNNRNQRLAAYQTHNEAFRANIALAATYPETWVAGLANYPNLSASENARFGFIIHASFRHIEQNYLLSREGVLDEAAAYKNIRQICSLCTYPGAMHWWRARKMHFDDDFVAKADAIMAEDGVKPFYEYPIT